VASSSDKPGTYEHRLFRQAIDARDQLVMVGVHGFRASSSGRSRNDELDSPKKAIKITKFPFGGYPAYKSAVGEGGSMISAAALTDTVSELGKTFAGQLLQPADPGYEDARKVHNGLIDKRPALIARCRCVADIVDAVKLASAAVVTTWLGSRRSMAAC
jgi:hypothetical protein